MAVIKATNKRGKVGPSLRGQFYSYEKDDGLILSQWPKPRGAAKSEAQLKAQELFTECCKAMKRMDGNFINYARLNSAGTPMLPRDALMAALYGRGPTMIFQDGTKRYSMASRVDMSQLLDNLADKDFMLLFRDDQDLWVGLPIGDNGDVLTVSPAGKPSWARPAGGSGQSLSWYLNNPASSATYDNLASAGINFVTVIPTTVKAAYFKIGPSVGRTWLAGVYKLNSSGLITEVMDRTSFTVADPSVASTVYVEFQDGIQFNAGEHVAILVTRTDATITSQTNIFGGTTKQACAPMPKNWGYSHIASVLPSVGETVNFGADYPFGLSWLG